MSRNKIIKMVHDCTGLSYKECRKLCKYHHWNNDKLTIIALTYDADTLGSLKESCDKIYAAIFEVGAKFAEGLATLCDNMGAAFRNQSERMQRLAAPFDINKDVFNFEETITASILNPSEVREQFGLEPIDVNDPHTPVFAPYYASTAGNGKLYQNDGGRNTDETGA